MKELLDRFESKALEIVFEQHCSETFAKSRGMINSLHGGGTRMRKGLGSASIECASYT